MAAAAGIGELGGKAVDFALPGVDGRLWRLADVRGRRATLVMFICNHCPYVQAAVRRIVRDARELAAHGVGAIAIMPNDTDAYPEDSLENMRTAAAAWDLPFPYVIDGSQQVARAYGAVCTPEFFGFNADLVLQYRGRLDVGGRSEVPGARREMYEALVAIAASGRGPAEQVPGFGCSIKWRGS